MFAICQQTVSSTANNGDWFERVDETESHIMPAVVPERTSLNRLVLCFYILQYVRLF